VNDIEKLQKKLTTAKAKLAPVKDKLAEFRARRVAAAKAYKAAEAAVAKADKVLSKVQDAEDRTASKLSELQQVVDDFASDLKEAKRQAAEAKHAPQNGVHAPAVVPPALA
jgi:chromosome segregation ATPase